MTDSGQRRPARSCIVNIMMGMPQPISASETDAVIAVSALPERILNAAAELVGQHGPQKTTVAEIARAAGVGKGTAYLYWSSKEELLLALLAHETLKWVLAVRDKLVRDPEDLCPSRLGVLLLDSWPRELVELIASDLYLRRILAVHQQPREALDRSMPMKLCLRVLPLLRQKGLVRDDADALEQAYVFDALMTGFVMGKMVDSADFETVDPRAVLSRAIRALFEPPVAPGRSHCERVLPEVLQVLDHAVAELNDVMLAMTRPAERSGKGREEREAAGSQ